MKNSQMQISGARLIIWNSWGILENFSTASVAPLDGFTMAELLILAFLPTGAALGTTDLRIPDSDIPACMEMKTLLRQRMVPRLAGASGVAGHRMGFREVCADILVARGAPRTRGILVVRAPGS